MTLSELASTTGISKSYLWNLENRVEHQRPSGETLYALAEALGTTMSALLGRRLLSGPNPDVDPALRAYADEAGLTEEEVLMLASIRWRGDRPQSVKRWRFVHEALRASRSLDIETS